MKAGALAIAFLLLSGAAQAVSVGVSPPRLDFDDVLRGGYAENSFLLSTDSNEIAYGHLTVRGNIANWIEFENNQTTFNVTKDEPRSIRVIVRPPPDTPVGRHSGTIEAVIDSTGDLSGRAGSIIKAGVVFGADVVVTGDEIISCKAGAFEFSDVEIGRPLELWTTVTNDGNTRITPLITSDIFDQTRENIVLSPQSIGPEILPTTTERFYERFTNTLPVGQYWASVEVPDCNGEGLVTFSVVERGAIADRGELVTLFAPEEVQAYQTVPVTASFVNHGSRVVSAKFKGQALLDGNIIAVLESDELQVEPGSSRELESFFLPEKDGRYEIIGRVIYNEKLTFEKGVQVKVGVIEESNQLFTILGLLLYLALMIGAVFIIRKKRR